MLRYSYTLIAPLYDLMVAGLTRDLRRRSLERLGDVTGKAILIPGIGTGLDIPFLPEGARYTGLDLTPAMLRRAQSQSRPEQEIALELGDAMRLPYADASYDVVVMHLILAVVPNPLRALQEATRVVRPGGQIVVMDKFLKANETAPLRRLLSPLMGLIATRTDVVFETLLAQTPQLSVQTDEALALGGWFRRIELQRQ